MVQQVINVGTAPNDGTGDTLKTSFTKTNANFTELYTRPLGNAYTTSPTAPSSPNPGDFWFDTTTGILASYVNDGNSSQWVEVSPSAGNIASASSFVNIQRFTSSGTYTPTPGTQFAIVEVVGGGGGGGGTNGVAGTFIMGGGGGSGGYSRSCLTGAVIGAAQTVTIGAGGAGGLNTPSVGSPGGDTSFGSFCIAKGGSGGFTSATGATQAGHGGAGGVAGTGDVVAVGAPGGNGHWSSASATKGAGEGGSSIFGGGAAPVWGVSGVVVNGNPGQNYGSGGGGGCSAAVATSSFGGAGSPGVVIVTEYNIGPGQQGPAGLAGGVTTPLTPQGRLTLQAGLPVMATTTSGATAIYYSPYCGNQIPIWNGSSWATMSFNELAAATTDATKSPAAIGVSKVNDWFVWNDAGTLRLGHGPDWTNDTTRAAVLVRQNGIWLNATTITNGPAASRGTYVGTTRSNASSGLDWIFGTRAIQGGAGFLGVWNCYNRVDVTTSVRTSDGSWSYAVTDYRAVQNSVGWRVSCVVGLAEEGVSVTYTTQTAGANASVSIGVDSTTIPSGEASYQSPANAGYQTQSTSHSSICPIGFHFFSAIEWAAAASSWVGELALSGDVYISSGLHFRLRM